jgi:hypothetical protein
MAAENPDAVDRLSEVAAKVGLRLPEVTREIGENLGSEIPQLKGDGTVAKILQASVDENVTTLLHIFENDIPAGSSDVPAAASEYARRLAQRDIPISALIRAYRIGHWRSLQWCLDELDRQGGDAVLLAATNRRMLKISFGYIDRVTEQVIEIY